MGYKWKAVVLKFGWKKPKKNVCNIADVRQRQTVLAAALNRFLVLGSFTNLAVIKNKVTDMFSLLRVKYLRSQ